MNEEEEIKKMLESISGPLNDMVSKTAALQIAQKIYINTLKDIDLQKSSAEQLMALAKSSMRAGNVFTTAASQDMDFSSNMMEMVQAMVQAQDGKDNPFDL